MLYASHFFMCASTFHDVLNGLAIRDTAVEQHKLNRMIDGFSALALHGIDTGGKPEFFDLTVFEPNDSQIKFLVHDVVDLGLESGKELPIAQMRELNRFTITRLGITMRIVLKRNTVVPDAGLLFRYDGTFYRVNGVNNISSDTHRIMPAPLQRSFYNIGFERGPEYCDTIVITPEDLEPRIGQEFLDEPWPVAEKPNIFDEKLAELGLQEKQEAQKYSVASDLETLCTNVGKATDLAKLTALSGTYEILHRCNKIDADTDTSIRQMFRNKEIELDPEG